MLRTVVSPMQRARLRLWCAPLPTILQSFATFVGTMTSVRGATRYLPRSCARHQHTIPLAVAHGSLDQGERTKGLGRQRHGSRWSIVRLPRLRKPRAAAVVTGVHHQGIMVERTPRESLQASPTVQPCKASSLCLPWVPLLSERGLGDRLNPAQSPQATRT